MSQVTVKQLAEVVGIKPDRLVQQMEEAGLEARSADAAITNDEKLKLLAHLRHSHGKGDTSVSAPRKITLNRKSTGTLRVQGAAGKQKTVQVEVRKRRTYVKRSELLQAEADDPGREEAIQAVKEIEIRRAKEDQERSERDEKTAQAAEAIAQKEAQKLARIEAEKKVEKDAEDERQRLKESERLEKEKEEKELAEAERTRQETERAAAMKAADASVVNAPTEPEQKAKSPAGKAAAHKGGKGAVTRYGRKELHVAEGAFGKRKPKKKGRHASLAKQPEKHGFSKPTAPVVREVVISDTISVAELAHAMSVKTSEVIKQLMGMGAMVTINQPIDKDTATLVVEEMGHTVKLAEASDIEAKLVAEVVVDEGETSPRPPVVTVMGHVDHGKTSLLDHIRDAKVADGEAGGITQHIGAYSVDTGHGTITFLDTPGHAAFTSMRARGAQATDIVVLVVAADDGVMPQTEEAIAHARAAKVPMIVAVNKIDKQGADPEKTRTELSKHEVVPEDWGGEDIFVNVSAITGEGVDDLLEAILLQAELLELGAVVDTLASGVVIESSLDKGRGPVATVLVKNGTLKAQDMILCGPEFGRVRAMADWAGNKIEEAGPSTPVQVVGLSGTPAAGDIMVVVANERRAREAAEARRDKQREERLKKQHASKLENIFSQMGSGGQLQVNLLIKADVLGSVEALKESLIKMSNDDVLVNVVASGAGGITESDAVLAQASDAIIIGFNVRADATARKIMKENELDYHYFSVIYEAIDTVKSAIEGVLGTETKENILGLAEVKDVFKSSSLGQIAGCLVLEGVVRRECPIRVLRDNIVIYEGELESLRRFKDEAKEVQSGTECGIGVKQYNDVKAGDQIECFERIEVARTLG